MGHGMRSGIMKIWNKIVSMKEGSAGFIPAGEEHSSINDSDSDAEVVWMLIEKK
ncbi:MAG: cupin domain-containing protein [Bacillota bacterium]|nr:cupin domain-containing protein [Bacillota bacterium]